VFEHASDSIREDYLIGKVLGTGINIKYIDIHNVNRRIWRS